MPGRRFHEDRPGQGGGEAAPDPAPTPAPDPAEVERLNRIVEDPSANPMDRIRAAATLHTMGMLVIRPAEESAEPPSPILDPKGKPYSQGVPRPPRPHLLTSLLDDIEEEDEEWLWPGIIPVGSITPILARMGDGKSTFLSYLASTVSRGAPWPDCPDDNEAGSVIILQAEESRSKAIKPRMAAFGFGARKVHLVRGVDRGDGRESWFSLAGDVETIADLCRRLGDVRLLIVDPISSYVRGVNGFNDVEMRAFYQPLFTLAEEFNLAVVPAAHPNKDGEKDILDRMSGSAALLQMARMGWYLSPDPRDRSRRLLSILKGNMLGATRTALAFHFDGKKKLITWFPDPVKLDARQVDHLLQKQAREEKLKARPGPDPTETRRAEEFILGQLAKGPCKQTVAEDVALNVGIKGSTFRKALKRLQVCDGRVVKYRGEEDGQFWLRIEAPASNPPPEAEPPPDPPGEATEGGT